VKPCTEDVMRVALLLGRQGAFQEGQVAEYLPRLERTTLRAVLRQAESEGRLRRRLGFYFLPPVQG
jgi:hypothetical protein